MPRLSMYGFRATLAAFVLASVPAQATTERVLYAFNGGADGARPHAGPIAVGGILYGTTDFGGAQGDRGTVFSLTGAGRETLVHSFQGGHHGDNTVSGLIELGGTIYGATPYGGGSGGGTLFVVTP